MTNNGIQIENTPNILIITDSDQNQITVTQPVTSLVEVTALGPQGQKGDQGDSIFTLVSGSTYATTSSLVVSGSFLVSGSSTFTNIGPAIFSGSVTTNQGFTGSLFGTSSYALTASYAMNGGSGGGGFYIATGSVSASVGLETGSFTITSGSSNLLTLRNDGGLNISSLTASSAIISGNVQVLGTASINTLIVNQTQLSTGSNQLGDNVDDFQTLYGTVTIPTGSLTVTGSTFISSSAQTQLQVGNNLLFVSSSGNIGIGTNTPSASLSLDVNGAGRFNGNLFINPTGSTTSNPRTIGTSGFNTGNAVRYQFGDALNSWQNSYGGRQTIQSYWGIEIYGGRQSLTELGFTNGVSSDPSVIIGGTKVANTVLQVIGASGQTGNLQEWRSISSALSTITSAGSLLLGTSTDSGFKLDVNGTGRFSGNLTITGSGTNSLLVKGSGTTSATTALLVQNANTSASLAVLDNSYVGINTTSPAYNLDVAGNIRGYSSANDYFIYQVRTLTLNGSNAHNNTVGFTIGTNAGNSLKINLGDSNIYGSSPRIQSNLGILFKVGNATESSAITALTITNLGLIGVGTTTPSASLHISGAASTSSAALLVYKSGSTVVDIQGSSGQLFSITDSLTGSLFSVNTIAGLPIIEAFSDNTVNIGKYGSYPIKVVNSGSSASITGSFSGSFLGNILTLTPQNPLPSGSPTGSFAVSSSVPPKPYFWDGTTWNALY